MCRHTASGFFALFMLLGGASHGLAKEEIRKESVQFKKGVAKAVIKGQIIGYKTVDYLLGAKADQTMQYPDWPSLAPLNLIS